MQGDIKDLIYVCIGITLAYVLPTAIVIGFIYLIMGCVSAPASGPFNNDDRQDPGCYGKYGSQWGYCDRRR